MLDQRGLGRWKWDVPGAVVMLSGGLDSATVAAFAKREGFAVTALSFDYGQRHRVELEAAFRVARQIGVDDHRRVQIDLRAIGGSALTSEGLAVPKDALGAQVGPPPALVEGPAAAPSAYAAGISGSGIPVTYVPARNTVFLAVALGLAEVIGAFDIFFGANALDYSGYPDCRPDFVAAFEALANFATRAAVEGRGRFRIHAPLLHRSKADIIKLGAELGVDFSLTHSCYDPVGDRACGHCDSCILRRRGFEAAGVPDTTRYA